MKDKSVSPFTLPQLREEDIRDYADHLYQQANCVPGHDLDNGREATAGLKANIPAHRSGVRLHQHVNEPEIGELDAISVAARPLLV